ncbi:MAG: hypothetical protein AUH31_09445 [Armatimonadetes bacterium 13_1_40CM_64_14]|nr:MAG: hypothetical protein AUH31_09445 [Armatimonadetes bacterium 13_1_40CM_64_14]
MIGLPAADREDANGTQQGPQDRDSEEFAFAHVGGPVVERGPHERRIEGAGVVGGHDERPLRRLMLAALDAQLEGDLANGPHGGLPE